MRSTAPVFAKISQKPVWQDASPTTGGTVNISAPNTFLYMTPAGTLATLTVNLPSSNLMDGDECTIKCSQIITALTLGAGGATIVDTITTIAVMGMATYMYRASSNTWYRRS